MICEIAVDKPWHLQNKFRCCSAKWCKPCSDKLILCANSKCQVTNEKDILIHDTPTFKIVRSHDMYHVKWYIDDRLHRENEPAHIVYDTEGNELKVIWYHHGEIHRDEGPAIIEYNKDHNVCSREYFHNGEKITNLSKEKNQIL